MPQTLYVPKGVETEERQRGQLMNEEEEEEKIRRVVRLTCGPQKKRGANLHSNTAVSTDTTVLAYRTNQCSSLLRFTTISQKLSPKRIWKIFQKISIY